MKFHQPDSYYAGYEAQKKYAETGEFYGSPFNSGTPDAYQFTCGINDYIDDHAPVDTASQQFESLAGSEKGVVWDGAGVPPVGCECELYDCEQWNPVRVKFVGDKYVVTDRTDLGYEVVYCLAEKPDRFRPIRTEAERKREESTQAMNIAWRARAGEEDDGKIKSIYEIIYDAIAVGKIPHIKLEK